MAKWRLLFTIIGLPNCHIILGIAAFWAKIVDLGFYKLTFQTEETLGPVADMACERCIYYFEDANGKELQRGK